MSRSKSPDDEEATTMVQGDKPDPIDTTVRIPASEDFHSGQFRTRYASGAMSLAEQFTLFVGNKPIQSATRFRVELATPDGPSTGGGRQALQHIKLVPTDGGATLVAGWCNQAERRAELRTLAFLDAEHAKRYETSSLTPPALPSERIGATHYNELLDRLRTFCAEQDFRVEMIKATPRTLALPVKAATGQRWAPWIALLVFFATCALVFFAARGR